MPQYVVHKIGFFYNDDAYEVTEAKGYLMAVYASLEEAKLLKNWEDIEVMKRRAGETVYRFYREKANRRDIYNELVEYCKTEFDHDYEKDFKLPQKINDEQAAQFLSIIEVSFHSIVEYGDDEVVDRTAFDVNEDENFWF